MKKQEDPENVYEWTRIKKKRILSLILNEIALHISKCFQKFLRFLTCKTIPILKVDENLQTFPCNIIFQYAGSEFGYLASSRMQVYIPSRSYKEDIHIRLAMRFGGGRFNILRYSFTFLFLRNFFFSGIVYFFPKSWFSLFIVRRSLMVEKKIKALKVKQKIGVVFLKKIFVLCVMEEIFLMFYFTRRRRKGVRNLRYRFLQKTAGNRALIALGSKKGVG